MILCMEISNSDQRSLAGSRTKQMNRIGFIGFSDMILFSLCSASGQF